MDDTYVQKTVTQGNVLLHNICKILNTNSWIIPEGIKASTAAKKSCISIKRIHSHFKEVEIVKDQHQLIDELIEQYIQVHWICQYYQVSLFEPLKMLSLMHQSIRPRFPVSLCTIFENNRWMFFLATWILLKLTGVDWMKERLSLFYTSSKLRVLT